MRPSNNPWGMTDQQMRVMFPEEYGEPMPLFSQEEPDPNDYYDEMREEAYLNGTEPTI